MAINQVSMQTAPQVFSLRLEQVFIRALSKLGPEVRQQLAALMTPEALAIVAAVLTTWVISHAFGIGELIDIIIATASSLSDLGRRSEKSVARDQILPDLKCQYRDIDQEAGEIWAAQAVLQPTLPKSDRLLAYSPLA